MKVVKTNEETITESFDQTFSALQNICSDFRHSPAFLRAKDQFLEERERMANNQEEGNPFEQYFSL